MVNECDDKHLENKKMKNTNTINGQDMNNETRIYGVFDTKTQMIVAQYDSRKKASRRADKLDDNYGAYRYIVKTL